MLQMSSKLLQR